MRIGIVIGVGLIIYILYSLFKIRNYKKTKAIVLGHGISTGLTKTRNTRIEFFVDQKSREVNLNYYNFFWRKGKKITIYYNPKKYWEVYSLESHLFLFLLGLLFIFVKEKKDCIKTQTCV